MTAAMPPARSAGGAPARPGPFPPSPPTLSALEDLAALAAKLLGAPWAAVRLGDGKDILDIVPSGLEPRGCPPDTVRPPAGDGDVPQARIVLADRGTRALTADEEGILSALGRQAAALLALDRRAADQGAIVPHFKTFLDNLPTAAFIKDEEHRYVFANRAFWKLYNGTGEEGDPGSVDESIRLSPDSVERVRQRDLEVLRTGRKQEYVEKLEYDGGEHTWWVCKFPVAGADGRPQVGGISLDISELDRARAGTRMYDLVFKNIEVGVIVWRLDDPARLESFRIVAINAAAARMTKVSAEEMLGKTMDYAYPEDIRQGFADIFRKVVLTGEPVDLGEVEYTDERIGRSYFKCNLFPLPDRMIGVAFENITERRTFHDRLARSMERFELMARTTNDGLFEMDLVSGTEWWNERLSALLGFAPGDAPSGGRAWADLVHPEDRERVSASVREGIAGRDDHFAREFRILRPDGGVRHLHARCHVVRDEGGRALRLLGAMLDVTASKLAEEAVRENEERYRRLVEVLPDVVAISIDGILEFVNPAGLAFRGTASEEEMLGRHILEFFHPDDRPRVAERQKRLALGESVPPLPFRFLRADGTAFEAESRAIPFPFRGKQANLVVIRDVAERRRAEEALRRSEEHYRLLFHGSPLPMYLVDVATLRFADVNRAAELQYGYSRDEFLSMTLEGIRPAEDMPLIREKVRRISTESGSLGIWRHRRKDGSLIQAEIVVHPLGSSDNPSTIMVIAQDVTERLLAVERMRLSEERYRTLARVSPVGLFRSDLRGNYLYVNEHCAQIVGMPADRLEGLGWMGIFHPEDRERAVAEWESAYSRGLPYNAEYRILRPDGRVVWADSRALPETDPSGSPVGYVGTLMDITERKQAETLLAGQKRILALIASGSPLGAVLDELLGFVEQEASGFVGGVLLSDADSGALAWASARGLPAAIRQAMDPLPVGPEGGPAGMAAAERRAADCPKICAEVTWLRGRAEALAHDFRACLARPILGTHGGLLGVLVWFSRAHGRPGPFEAKLLETALDLAGIAVERRRQEEIARRNQELSEENRRILEANRMKSEFLASMSHELRTPLNAIIGFSQLLIDRKVGPLTDKQGEYMGDILDGGMHLLRLINDVLDLAKIESGKMQLFLEPVPVLRAVREVCDILMPMALAKGIGFRVAADLDPETAVLDSQKFKQVLYNLVSNAIKFSHQGGAVAISAARDAGGSLRLEVADRGIGIRKEDLGRLFQEFQQLDSGAARHFPGTGLGLVITKKLVELHKGSVGVESRPGEGSVFSAVFPPLEPPEP